MNIRFLVLTLILLLTTAGCSSLNEKVKLKIETVGSRLTETTVTVETVDLKIARGIGRIENFKVANPEGYTDQYAVDWKLLDLNIGVISTIAGDPFSLDKLLISSPVINLERTGPNSSNLRAIAENCQRNIAHQDSEPADKERSGPPFRIKIKELTIEGVTLNVRTVDNQLRSGTLPPVTLTDIGGDKGVTPAGLGVIVAGAVTGEMLKQAIARELIERAGNIKDALAPENILAILHEELDFSEQQLKRVRPLIDDLSTALTATIDIWVEQEHVDFEVFRHQLNPVIEEFKERLAAILDSQQFQTVHSRLTRLQDDAVEIVLFLAVEQISTRTDISPEQLRQLRPILREHLLQLNRLVRQFRDDPDEAVQTLLPLYDKLLSELHERLEEHLTPNQIDRLFQLFSEIRDRLHAGQASAR